ncbi:alpha/beta fold hydrolase [Fundicoccus culcitae]|uniref:Alpha/beta hydrolase n=1 Tax=Fundicoccus culcitae TaxID=2969821 RepID=A0ABY5P8J1_9LACT|nr:alpha/beta hydrolase [Fundicoccus culcitae]UUX35078.1 alpha/beta hydrolase [Fundicoccus culcitae]
MKLIDNLEKVQDFLNGNGSEEFLGYYAAEHYTGPIMIIEDDEVATLHLTNGHIDEITVGKPDADENTYIGVGGEGRIWDHLKDNYQRSIQYINTDFADDEGWKVYGPKLLNRQFNTTLAHIARIYSYIRDNEEIYSDRPIREANQPVLDNHDYVRGFYITVNGVKIYVETNDGPTDKGVIIALHTAGRENRQYHDLMNIFKDKYRIYAPDQPGHGKSMPLQGNTVVNDYNEYGNWIWDITKALGVDRPIYVGCSMSGGIVYHMAIEHPDEVRAVVCMQGNDDTSVEDTSGMIPLLTHPANNVGVTQREFSDSMVGRKTSQDRFDFIRWGVATETSVLKRGDFDICFFFDIKDRVHEVKCPVRIIEGTDDTIYTVEMAKGTMERLTGTDDKELHVIDGYGHFIAVESPEKVAPIIEDLIESLDDGYVG